VIAHEIGHHVQNQLGITEKVAQQRARAGATRSNPVSVTYGSAAQRVRWFRAGLDSGDVRQCNTFATARP
jgi:predicted metalloprotease